MKIQNIEVNSCKENQVRLSIIFADISKNKKSQGDVAEINKEFTNQYVF